MKMASLSSHKQTYKMIIILGLMSAGLLSAAYAFEHIGGLVPCKLCIWQRVPHFLIIAVALMGLASLRAGLVLFLIAALPTRHTRRGEDHRNAGLRWRAHG